MFLCKSTDNRIPIKESQVHYVQFIHYPNLNRKSQCAKNNPQNLHMAIYLCGMKYTQYLFRSESGLPYHIMGTYCLCCHKTADCAGEDHCMNSIHDGPHHCGVWYMWTVGWVGSPMALKTVAIPSSYGLLNNMHWFILSFIWKHSAATLVSAFFLVYTTSVLVYTTSVLVYTTKLTNF